MKPLIPRRLRVPALVAAALGWLIALTLGTVYAGDRHAGVFDERIIRFIHTVVGRRSTAANVLVSPTDAPVVYALLVALVVAGLVLRRWTVAALAVVAPGFAIGMCELVLKPGFDRTYAGGLSYPSGHTIAAVTTYTVALLMITSGASRWWRVLATTLWALLTFALMVGLVAMNYHYPTDTIGGFCIAMGVVLPLAVLADVVNERTRRPRQSIPEPRSEAKPDQLPTNQTSPTLAENP